MEVQVTRLLKRMADGDSAASEDLFKVVYADLRARAARLMRGPNGHTLQPTAVVNEAWLKLSGGESDWENRNHSLSVAAKAMRSVLVDHAREKRAAKRGGGIAERVELETAVSVLTGTVGELLAERARDRNRISSLERQVDELTNACRMYF